MGTVMAGTARCREEEEEEWGRRGRGGGEEEEEEEGETSLLWRALERLLVWQRVGEEEEGGRRGHLDPRGGAVGHRVVCLPKYPGEKDVGAGNSRVTG